eukprot:1142196-Pelagomonas_calceolata.AAC.6
MPHYPANDPINQDPGTTSSQAHAAAKGQGCMGMARGEVEWEGKMLQDPVALEFERCPPGATC